MSAATIGTSVIGSTNAQTLPGYNTGEAITAGKSVYLDRTTGLWMLADADALTTLSVDLGIATHTAVSGGRLLVAVGGLWALSGATLTKGTPYFVGLTAGDIGPFGDLASGDFPAYLGMAYSSTSILLQPHLLGVAI